MECVIKRVINSTTDYGKLNVNFLLTDNEVRDLKTVLVNWVSTNIGFNALMNDPVIADPNYAPVKLALVMLQAMDRANIKG